MSFLKYLYRFSFVFLWFTVLGTGWGQTGIVGKPKGGGTPPPEGVASQVIPALQVPYAVGDTMHRDIWLPIEAIANQRAILMGHHPTLIVLYFWHTTCHGCWAKFPLLRELMDHFKGVLTVITVTNEPTGKVDRFFQNRPELKALALPAITGDSVLSAAFPHQYLSHVVWLTNQGFVQAVTHAEYLNACNIAQAFNGQVQPFKIKRDYARLDILKPLLVWNEASGYRPGPDSIAYQAMLPYLDGLVGTSYQGKYSGGLRATLLNVPLLNLYRFAWYPLPDFDYQFIVPDSLRHLFFKPDSLYYDDWIVRNGSGMEIADPITSDLESLRTAARSLLSKYYPYKVKQDTIPMETFCITGQYRKPSGAAIDLQRAAWQFNKKSRFPIDVVSPSTLFVQNLPTDDQLKQPLLFAAWLQSQGLQFEKKWIKTPVCYFITN